MFPILGWEKLLYLHGRDLGECRALQGFRILLNHPKEMGGDEQALSSCPEEAGYGWQHWAAPAPVSPSSL